MPLSSIISDRYSDRRSSATSTESARACLATLFSASCARRYTVSISGVKRSSVEEPVCNRARMPLCVDQCCR